MALTLINDYEVMYSSNTFPPRILLMSAGKFIGQLIFHPDGTPLPPDNQIGGQVQLMFVDLPASIANIKAGRLRALADQEVAA